MNGAGVPAHYLDTHNFVILRAVSHRRLWRMKVGEGPVSHRAYRARCARHLCPRCARDTYCGSVLCDNGELRVLSKDLLRYFAAQCSIYTFISPAILSQSRKARTVGRMSGVSSRRYCSVHTSVPLLTR